MDLRSELEAIVGPVGLVPADDHERFSVDWAGKFSTDPVAVVRPASTAEVAAVVSLCATEGVAIVPQGGNTGLCGGSIPSTPVASVVLSLSRMNTVRSLDVNRATVTVEAGVTIQALQAAAADVGLLFAPDWGARGSAQVGGGVSTNAGGLNVLRWGSMREQILGLEVVLPDGRVWDGLRALRKDSSGLDLKHLFIGSEGTLGIVTAVVFKLHSLPSTHQTAFVALSSLDSLIPFFSRARTESKGLVSAFELVPEEGIRRVLANMPSAQRPLATISDWYVLLRMSGDDDVTETLGRVLESAAAAGQIVDAAVASTSDQEENLWTIRDEIPPPFTFDARGRRHKFDMAVPVDRVVDFLVEAGPVVDAVVPGTLTYGFGHVGDGNIHFNVYPGPDADVDAFDARGADLEAAIDELTWSFGGTISAEHGVGQIMRARMSGQKSDVEIELMERVKAALDPAGIMNPGKVIPERAPHSG
ncbi:MAG: FAD-binding oxidoreductase [Acidimicrobiales bacterium]